MDDFTTPMLPKGRGLWRRDVDCGNVGRINTMPEGFTGGCGFTADNVQTSTPNSDANVVHQLTDVVAQLGAQIGESIVAQLRSAGVVNLSNDQNPSLTRSPTCDVTKCDSPHVTVHVTPDRDVTKTYLKKKGTPLHEQAEEITGHLLGRARDVVKIALRGDPNLNVSEKPAKIYDILLRYFSDAPSCLPLADFYGTLPRHKENPVDYWIRLNKAADRAHEGLRRQGNAPSSLNKEVALMFVKHCPDPELSSTFKWKPIHEWSSKDVQLRIDDYQRELRANQRASGTTQLGVHAAAVADEQFIPSHVAIPEQCRPASHLPNANGALQSLHNPLGFASLPAPQVVSQNNPDTFASAPVVHQNLQQSEERLMSRMVEMFQGVLDKMQRNNGPPRVRQRRAREPCCRVCTDTGHSTISHCMSERLCFECLAPGHTRPKCPNVKSESVPPQNQGN
ncbi:unnamed protein product [Knipowitschia caucasica]